MRGIRWIIKAEVEGWRSYDIACVHGVSVRRVQQLYSTYRRCGRITPRKVGRPKAPNISEYERFSVCACYLEHILSSYGIRINHNRIYRVLKEEGLGIYLVYLPPYSPDLNPIEFGWKDLKRELSSILDFDYMVLKSEEAALKLFAERKTSYTASWVESFIQAKG